MCDWMSDPAFIGYAFECDEAEAKRREEEEENEE